MTELATFKEKIKSSDKNLGNVTMLELKSGTKLLTEAVFMLWFPLFK